MKRINIVLFLFTFLTAFSQEITVENIWKKYEYSASGVNGFSSMKDGEHYTRINEEGSILVYSVINANDQGTVLIDVKDLLWDGKAISISDFSFNADETKVLIMTDKRSVYRRSYTSVDFLFDLKTKKLEPLSIEFSPMTLSEYSPDGNFVSFIHGNDLYIKNIKNGTFKKLTHDGKRNKVINGTTDWVYEEEFSITKAYTWSPDSKQIAYLKFIEKEVKEFSFDLYGELYPKSYEYKYPKAGEANSKVSAYVVSIDKGKSIPLNLGEYEYIPRIQWSQYSNDLVLQTMNRHQNELKYVRFDFSNKKVISSEFFVDKSETYVDVNDKIYFLPSGKGVILTSEMAGFIQLYEIGFDKSVNAVTLGQNEIIDVYGITTDGKQIYYTKASEGGISKNLCVTDLANHVETKISPSSGYMNAEFTQGMKYFVGTFSSANEPPVYTLCKNDGSTIRVLEDNAALSSKLTSLNLSKKVFQKTMINGTELNVSIIYPENFDPKIKYPVYMNVYGGPGHNEVTNSWDGSDYMFHQLLAKKGYMVVSVDPRGTQYRGSSFKKCTYLQLGKYETEDIISTAKYFRSLPYVDSSRIGIMGWSYGGFMASLAITKGYDVFKTAIAVAPVTNWRYYDNIYTERFMRTPQENADGYDSNSPINHVQKMTGNYFLIHGTADDNVHFQNSLDMISALVKANKQFDLFVYPNKNHGIYGGNTRNHLFTMMYDYILKNL